MVTRGNSFPQALHVSIDGLGAGRAMVVPASAAAWIGLSTALRTIRTSNLRLLEFLQDTHQVVPFPIQQEFR